jgi:hypothetical protein
MAIRGLAQYTKPCWICKKKTFRGSPVLIKNKSNKLIKERYLCPECIESGLESGEIVVGQLC